MSELAGGEHLAPQTSKLGARIDKISDGIVEAKITVARFEGPAATPSVCPLTGDMSQAATRRLRGRGANSLTAQHPMIVPKVFAITSDSVG